MSLRRLIIPLALGCLVLLLPVVASAAGTQWTEAEVVLPGSANELPNQAVQMPAVSCPTTTSCVAIAQYHYADGPNEDQLTRPLLVSERSGTWQVTGVDAPLPHNAGKTPNAVLTSIDCSTAKSCTAVGVYGAGRWGPPLLVSESGGKWSAAVTPKPQTGQWRGNTENTLSVSCSSPAHCVAVGYGSVLLTQKGKTWSTLNAPSPKDAQPGIAPSLTSVDCPSGGNCVAVGNYYPSAPGSYEAMIETEHNGRWHAAAAPLPKDYAAGNPQSSLSKIVCPSSGNCTAMGTYASTVGYEAGLLLTESNGVWSAARAPLPGDLEKANPELQWFDLACSSPAHCAVTARYANKKGIRPWVVITDAGDGWTAAKVPAPASLTLGYLDAVTCPSALVCMLWVR